MTHLRKIMLEELRRRNYAQITIDCCLRTVEHFSRHFNRSPDQLGPEHIRECQAALFTRWKLAPNTVTQRLEAIPYIGDLGSSSLLEANFKGIQRSS